MQPNSNNFVSLNDIFNYDNRRLFISGIPRSVKKYDVQIELKLNGVTNITDIILYTSTVRGEINRGFVFVEFESHEIASRTRAALKDSLKLFGKKVTVDWSYPLPDVSTEVMAQVKRLFMRNLPPSLRKHVLLQLLYTIVPEYAVEKLFKERSYCFIHFTTRQSAEIALQKLTEVFSGSNVEITWSKPTPYGGPVKQQFSHQGHFRPTSDVTYSPFQSRNVQKVFNNGKNYHFGNASRRTPTTTEFNSNPTTPNDFPNRQHNWPIPLRANNGSMPNQNNYGLLNNSSGGSMKWWNELPTRDNSQLCNNYTSQHAQNCSSLNDERSTPKSAHDNMWKNDFNSYNTPVTQQGQNFNQQLRSLSNPKKLWNGSEESEMCNSRSSLNSEVNKLWETEVSSAWSTHHNKAKKQLDKLWSDEAGDDFNVPDANYNGFAQNSHSVSLQKAQSPQGDFNRNRYQWKCD